MSTCKSQGDKDSLHHNSIITMGNWFPYPVSFIEKMQAKEDSPDKKQDGNTTSMINTI